MFVPIVRIGGVDITGVWNEADQSQLVAVAPMTIAWGSREWLAEGPPATLTVSIADRAGTYATSNALNGQAILVYLPINGQVIFRGTIGDVAVAIRRRTSPLTGATERYYLLTLTCDDHQATAAQAKGLAPASADPNQMIIYDAQGGLKPAGPRRWRNEQAASRQSNINAMAQSIGAADSVTYPLPYLSPNEPQWHGTNWNDDLSLWDIFTLMIRSWPLANPFYDPTQHIFNHYIPQFSPTVGVARQAGGMVLVFTPYAGEFAWGDKYTVLQVPAQALEYADDGQLTSTVSQAIDASNVTLPYYVYQGGFTVAPAARDVTTTITDSRVVPGRPSGRLAKKTLDYQADLSETITASGGRKQFMSNLAPRVATTLAGTNDNFAAPVFRLRFDDHPELPANVLNNLILPTPRRLLWAFPGAEFNSLPNVGPAFHIIGGVHSWDPEQGWSAEFYTAPTAGTKPAALTLDQLFSASAIPLSEMTLTFDDLSLPQTGLTT